MSYQHHIGSLSKCGVLDVGRRCPHSCIFCYHSFKDGSKDQFYYLRHADWMSKDDCYKILNNFLEWGLTHFDCTGGEPTLHPNILELIAYAHQVLGLKGRIITLGQFLQQRFKGSVQTRLDELLDAGLNDFLFSFHAVDQDIFRRDTGADVVKVQRSMECLDNKGFSYCVNCVVYEGNYKNLPETAKYLRARNLRIVNFIVLKIEWGLQNQRDLAVSIKARYTEMRPYLIEAIDLLESKGIAVNVRYIPYCSLKGHEYNIVGFKSVELDPYEWRNGVRGSNEGLPFLLYKNEREYLDRHIPMVETHKAFNMRFVPACEICALKPICDGVDADYIALHGHEEFSAYPGQIIRDLSHYRYNYPGPYTMKEHQYE